MLETNKTDRIDAQLLAEYARRMEPRPWQPPQPELLAVRDLGRRINQLAGTRTAALNRRHALKSKQCTDPLLIEDAEDEIAALDKRIERLAQAAQERIGQIPDLQRIYQSLLSVTGIADASAIKIIAELCLLDRTMSSRQVSRHAGLSVKLTESGSSLHKPGRLNKDGNAYLRSALFMPTLVMVQHDPIARAHYQHLIAKGKKKMQALCAVKRKLLTGLWACIQTGSTFNSEKLFAIRPQES